MRFLLVNPYYPISEVPSPPLGLAFIGSALESAGVDVRLLDYVVFPYDKNELNSVLLELQPRFVGLTAVTMNFHEAMRVIRDVKDIAPGVTTVMGGPHVTFCAEETMEQYPELDLIVLGEGERTIVDVVKTVELGKPLDEVHGIVFRHGDLIIRTAPHLEPLDVNSLPLPARHLLPLGRYKALNLAISMTTSRGCPFKCIFCVGRSMVGAKVRYRRPDLVVDELEYLGTLGFSQINIADDLFTANKRHCLDICDEIARRNLKIKWSSFARVDTVSTELLAAMKAAGCHSVSFGVESANADILKTIQKGITTDQVIAAVKACSEVGILPCASFILGLPGETPETLQETVTFAKKLNKMGVKYGYHLLAPFPGTMVREHSDDYGLRILTDDWSEYHGNRAIVETSAVDKKTLDSIVIEWEENALKWLAIIAERVDRAETGEEESSLMDILERNMQTYQLMMERAVETHGRVQDDSHSSNDRLERLWERLVAVNGYSPAPLKTALTHAVEKGVLYYQEEDDGISWRWRNYLERQSRSER